MDEVKNYILDKSKARFSHYGYVKTTIGDICHDCKVSKATVYKLFDSKETMVANLISREITTAHQALQRVIDNELAPSDKFVQFIYTALHMLSNDPFLMVLLDEDAKVFLSFFTKQICFEEDLYTLLVGIIREGKAQGVFHEVDATVVAYVVIGLLRMLPHKQSLWMMGEGKSQEEHIDALTTFLVHALK